MGNELVPRIREAAGLRAVENQRVPREIARRIDRAAYEAVIAGAKASGIGYATHVAMLNIAMVSDEEGRLIKQVPLAEPRLQAIGDNAAGAMAAIIARMGL